jgi:hypothetical protein
LDPATGLPHIYNHNVDEVEVIEVLEKPGEDRAIYVPDPQPDSVFVITAYELVGKPLAAFRRRRKKKHQ